MTNNPPLNLILRAARPQDAEGFAALTNSPGFRWGTAQLPFNSPEKMRNYLEKLTNDDQLIFAFIDDELVGSISLHRRRGRRSHVGDIGMGVHDKWVRKGIGTNLMTAIIDLSDNWLGLTRLQLEVSCDNLPAVTLYRRFGFEVEGTHRKFLLRDGFFVDGYTMARLKN
ncbi:N-acetyltransferase GCN5 [Acetobacter pasteurianus NBRC 3280]|uniref:N-acetyltransferase GCN5 n=1 Tax=Acetobacter pasteurianus NBRC 3278 TaxID=1226660 RepID=A0A401X8R8_ACEPA|nr:GNAT family N-acetyltransferase [Acetobacter pasteurianus]GCD60693.1 N-acetyltransferase GCN5 [Acetobacter pasteurianus NBRC 3277]GCD64292.1 N-acetyltransferase GCN5 [Acetobacter pasteurianus NBRC 3278]GCD70658.1 N-acetyltransferase GCN5 [Acetobacter pasteurianus NBRC 3280]